MITINALSNSRAAVPFGSPEKVAATFVAADDALTALIGDGPVVTDDRPRIEYFNLYPNVGMSYDEIIKAREPLEKYLTVPPDNVATLQRAREVVTLIWNEHQASAASRNDEARLFLRRALTRDPDNPYLAYLRGAQQQRGN